jgi:hypothetical protein
MTTKTIQVPASIADSLTVRWFVEYVIDNSPKFQTASAIAKAALLLGADLDTPGRRDVDAKALELLRAALLDEETPLVLPTLMGTPKAPDGTLGEPQPVTPRVFAGYLSALLNDAPEAEQEAFVAESEPQAAE